jgi:hypothetical protein
MQPAFADEHDEGGGSTQFVLEHGGELVPSVNPSDVQEDPVLAKAALQLAREMIRGPASVGSPVIDKDDGLLGLRRVGHCG